MTANEGSPKQQPNVYQKKTEKKKNRQIQTPILGQEGTEQTARAGEEQDVLQKQSQDTETRR